MSATNRYINWSGVGFTPTGGSLTSIASVTSVKPSRTGHPEEFKGDAALFVQAIAVPTQHREVDVETADVKAAAGLAIGSVGTLVATLGDFLNGTTAAGGGFTLTVTNAVLVDNPFHGDHAKTAMGTLKFKAYAPNGTTDPFTITAL
jgi:hypothetical protein